MKPQTALGLSHRCRLVVQEEPAVAGKYLVSECTQRKRLADGVDSWTSWHATRSALHTLTYLRSVVLAGDSTKAIAFIIIKFEGPQTDSRSPGPAAPSTISSTCPLVWCWCHLIHGMIHGYLRIIFTRVNTGCV